MNLLNGNLRKIYRNYLFTSLGSAVVLSVYTMVDTIAVGQYAGGMGTAAMAVITPIWGIATFFSMLCSIGGSVLMARERGAGRPESSRNYFTVSVLLLSAISGVLWVLMLFFGDPMLRLLGADDALLPYAREYADWIRWFFPVFVFSAFMVVLVRNDEAPARAVAAVLIGGGFNIFGDWFLVFVLDMGIRGAAIATLLGEVIQNCILFARLRVPASRLRFVRPQRLLRSAGEILRNGFSAGLIDLANAGLIILFNAQILRYGNGSTLAVYGVICNCAYLFMALFSGVGQAAQPLISTNLGAGQPKRILQTLRMALTSAAVLGALIALSGILFPAQLIRLFIGADSAVLAAAPAIMRPYFLSFLLTGVNICAAYYFQSILAPRRSLLLSLLRGIVLSGLLVLVLPAVCGPAGIWWTMPLTELLVALLAAVLLVRQTRARACG